MAETQEGYRLAFHIHLNQLTDDMYHGEGYYRFPDDHVLMGMDWRRVRCYGMIVDVDKCAQSQSGTFLLDDGTDIIKVEYPATLEADHLIRMGGEVECLLVCAPPMKGERITFQYQHMIDHYHNKSMNIMVWNQLVLNLYIHYYPAGFKIGGRVEAHRMDTKDKIKAYIQSEQQTTLVNIDKQFDIRDVPYTEVIIKQIQEELQSGNEGFNIVLNEGMVYTY